MENEKIQEIISLLADFVKQSSNSAIIVITDGTETMAAIGGNNKIIGQALRQYCHENENALEMLDSLMFG